MIVSIRTDKPEAEVGLLRTDGTQISYIRWMAHRELSATLLSTIRNQLALQKADFTDVNGVVVFSGPGSFTGLRIGVAVANALAYGLRVPVVGKTGDDWLQRGFDDIGSVAAGGIVLPEYGAEAHVSKPKV